MTYRGPATPSRPEDMLPASPMRRPSRTARVTAYADFALYDRTDPYTAEDTSRKLLTDSAADAYWRRAAEVGF